jgi:hypothetical protein
MPDQLLPKHMIKRLAQGPPYYTGGEFSPGLIFMSQTLDKRIATPVIYGGAPSNAWGTVVGWLVFREVPGSDPVVENTTPYDFLTYRGVDGINWCIKIYHQGFNKYAIHNFQSGLSEFNPNGNDRNWVQIFDWNLNIITMTVVPNVASPTQPPLFQVLAV